MTRDLPDEYRAARARLPKTTHRDPASVVAYLGSRTPAFTCMTAEEIAGSVLDILREHAAA